MTPPVVRHAHLCPDCKLLFWCLCVDGWTVAYAPCGCKR